MMLGTTIRKAGMSKRGCFVNFNKEGWKLCERRRKSYSCKYTFGCHKM